MERSRDSGALAPYAMHEAATRGRRYREAPHAYRSEYARDRDRIIHSRAFRRLQAKTQVFTTRFSDHFRTRLTHTLEVAQLARTAAAALRLNADLAEALALAHDLGHPPFGHAGEEKLDELMRQATGGAEGFDHNLHALRIVEQFEQRYIDYPGLNLTFEVREGIVKHSHDYAPGEHPELAEYRLEVRPPLEAQLIDLVDEIAYNTADLDDALESGLLELEMIRDGVPLFAEKFEEVTRRNPRARWKLQFMEANKQALDALVTDLLENTRQRLAAAGIAATEDVRAHPQRLAAFSAEAASHNRKWRAFLKAEFYGHPRILEDREQSVEMLAELFRRYLHQPEVMPPFYARQAEERRSRPRVVCDYIAGMTDQFLLRMHAGPAAAEGST